MTRNFICTKGNADKFWTVKISGKSITTFYGKNNKYGESKNTKNSFETVELCEKEAGKLIAAKLKDGYEEVSLNFPDVPVYVLKYVQDAIENKATELRIDVSGMELVKEICKMVNLKKLKLEKAKVIPEDIGNLKELEDLEISYSEEMQSLPKEIGLLTKLKRLEIGNTSILSLPDEIGNLTGLKNLRITGNTKLKALPETIGQLANLEETYIQGNCQNGELHIPKTIGDLKKLKELELPSNNLKTIPAEIGNLENLTKLDLNFNKIKELPKEIFSLENLESLSILYNPITVLPVELCNLINLTDLDLEGLQITNIPEEIVEEGVEAIFDFLSGGNEEKKQRQADEISPDVIKQALPKYKERIDDFYRKVKSKAYKPVTKKTLEELMVFLNGQSNSVPLAKTGDHYYFQHITKVFAPFKEWTFIDHRILSYITQNAWSFKKDKDGFHEDFYRWLKGEIESNDLVGLFQDVIEELKKYDIDENLILKQSLNEMSTSALKPDGKISSYGQYLVSIMESKINVILESSKEYYEVKENITDLFIRYKEKEFEKYIPDLLVIKEYDGTDGKKHIPFDTLDRVCKINPQKYEKYVIDLLSQSDCISCIAETGRILKDFYKDKYDDKVFEIVKTTLEHVSEKKNQKSGSYEFSWSQGERYSDGMPQYIEWVLKNYGKKAQEIVFKYVENTHALDLDVIQVVVKYLGQDAVDIAAEALNMTIESNDIAGHYRQLFTMLAGLDYSKYLDKAWEIARSEFKEVRETACLALSKLDGKAVIPKAKELLTSKKSYEREAGILILSLINSKESQAILKTLLDTEKNDDARDIIAESIYAGEESITVVEAKERVKSANARGKLEKFPAKWIDEKTLPVLKWTDKKAVGIDVVRFLMYRQARQKEIKPDFEAKAIYPLIDKKTSGDFAFKLLQMLLKNGGAKAQNRFALTLVGMLGDDRIVAPLEEIAINAMNENCCATLGLHDSMESARALDKIMQAFRIKYPNVKNAAKESFDRIAGKMGMTTFELSDKMIPDFGFAGLSKKFKIGKEEYTAKIDKNMKLAYTDSENKALKSLPKTATEKLKGEYKEMGNQIREMVKQQKVNMENYLVIQRKWNKEDWETFFLGNPLAFAFAQNFVWAVYDKNKIKLTFNISEDLSITDVKGKAAKLTGEKIGLVHPMDLSEAEKNEWKKYLSEKGIEPPFAQIERTVYIVTDEEKEKTISYMFEETTLNSATFKNRAEKLGWRRGSVVDAGEVSSYRKSYEDKQLEVFVKTEGMGVQLDFDSQVTLGEFYFIKQGSIVTGSYTYDEPRDEKDERLIKFADVPKIIYSETINDLKKITKKKDEEE